MGHSTSATYISLVAFFLIIELIQFSLMAVAVSLSTEVRRKLDYGASSPYCAEHALLHQSGRFPWDDVQRPYSTGGHRLLAGDG